METPSKKQRFSLQSPLLLLLCFGVLVASVLASASLALSILSFKEVSQRRESRLAQEKFGHSVNEKTRMLIPSENEDQRVRRDDATTQTSTIKVLGHKIFGTSRSSESALVSGRIHLVGKDGDQTNFITDTESTKFLIKKWKIDDKYDGSTFSLNDGAHIKVEKSGYYFIYSQMFYCDQQVDHFTCINGKTLLMKSKGNGTKEKCITKYQGGVFPVQKGDSISVYVSPKKRIMMYTNFTYFGAFLLRPINS